MSFQMSFPFLHIDLLPELVELLPLADCLALRHSCSIIYRQFSCPYIQKIIKRKVTEHSIHFKLLMKTYKETKRPENLTILLQVFLGVETLISAYLKKESIRQLIINFQIKIVELKMRGCVEELPIIKPHIDRIERKLKNVAPGKSPAIYWEYFKYYELDVLHNFFATFEIPSYPDWDNYRNLLCDSAQPSAADKTGAFYKLFDPNSESRFFNVFSLLR